MLAEIERYLSADVRVRRGDVKSTWSGIRPLVRDPKSKNTGSSRRRREKGAGCETAVASESRGHTSDGV